MPNPRWFEAMMSASSLQESWREIFDWLLTESMRAGADWNTLHTATVGPDRLLAEAAWELWEGYSSLSTRTASVLPRWWEQNAYSGRAILVLDALSLRELPLIVKGARERGIDPKVRLTAAEVPCDTNSFAKAMGLSGRASLENNSAPAGFAIKSGNLYTDVLESPFADCVGSVKPVSDIFLWHSWLDDQVHTHKRSPAEVEAIARQGLTDDAFWNFVNKLRQNRKLIITSDHGYAVCQLFSTTEDETHTKAFLVEHFGAMRYCRAINDLGGNFLPPLAVTCNNHHVVIGQRRWSVKGGFPNVDHGGLTLLEAVVPFIEIPEVS